MAERSGVVVNVASIYVSPGEDGVGFTLVGYGEQVGMEVGHGCRSWIIPIFGQVSGDCKNVLYCRRIKLCNFFHYFQLSISNLVQ